jgi:hypothetical protein
METHCLLESRRAELVGMVDEPMTLREIGERWGVTRERARQIIVACGLKGRWQEAKARVRAEKEAARLAARRGHGYASRRDRERYGTYSSWVQLRQRCENPKNPTYKYYGARGVKICDRWREFKNFLEDMGERPGPGWCLSRHGDQGDYEPGNCAWKTRSQNSRESRMKALGRVTPQEAWGYSKMGLRF